jgi:hypothetical protein
MLLFVRDTHFIRCCTQVSSAFLFGGAYMHSLFSGFCAKEDGTFTPRLRPLFPSLSERPPKNNIPRSSPVRPSTHLRHRDFFLGHNLRFTFLGGLVSLVLLLSMPPLFFFGHHRVVVNARRLRVAIPPAII